MIAVTRVIAHACFFLVALSLAGGCDSNTGLGNGAAGVGGTAGAITGSAGASPTGSAGATQGGSGGSNSAALGGAGGTGVTTAKGCDIAALVGSGSSSMPGKYFCTVPGCHGACTPGVCAADNSLGATGLDMTSADWTQKLVGTLPSNAPDGMGPSLCVGVNEPYLIKGTLPARGLFLDKLRSNPPCGSQMPTFPPPITTPVSAEDMDCFQRWANALTAQ